MTIYGVDVASYQGNPNWSSVYSAGVRFGFSKVSESTSYVNPTWAHNRSGMLGLGDGFLGGAYHFLHGGSGAAQARYFLSKADDVSNLAVALDVEASGADAATSREWVAEFKDKTGGHPVIGYFPRWYWEAHGRPDLSFFDTIWQSAYVSGSGTPASLFGKVPSSWWATFGNEPISILQFSSSGTVAGISGRCDVNAFRGSLDELRALALGEVDMPLTKADATVLWQTDGIVANPTGDKNNPEVRPAWLLTDTNQQIRNVALMVAALSKQVGDVDEDAIVKGVLAGLAPESIAAAVVAALPAELASQVVDEIQSRLAS
jgi:GH25 family lysozyme M1 (1,4-beta-N-acetylmuramidase)